MLTPHCIREYLTGKAPAAVRASAASNSNWISVVGGTLIEHACHAFNEVIGPQMRSVSLVSATACSQEILPALDEDTNMVIDSDYMVQAAPQIMSPNVQDHKALLLFPTGDNVTEALQEAAARVRWHFRTTVEDVDDEDEGGDSDNVGVEHNEKELNLHSEAERAEDEFFEVISVWDQISEDFLQQNKASSKSSSNLYLQCLILIDHV